MKRKYIFMLIMLCLVSNIQCEQRSSAPSVEKPIGEGSLIGAWTTDTPDKGMWIYKIGYQDQSTVIGNKVIYNIEPPVLIPFTGSFNSADRSIIIIEKNVKNDLAGMFKGKIDGSIKSLRGTWLAYNGDSLKIYLSKSRENYNGICYPSKFRVEVLLTFSEAYYNGSFGISRPKNIVLSDNYRRDVGKTFFAGLFPANEEIEFFIHVNNTGITYNTGNYDHASVIQLSAQKWEIRFEDSENVNDWDYDDLIVVVKLIDSGDDYPEKYKNTYCDCRADNCRENCGFDEWGFCIKNCTSFVAWRMNRDFGNGLFFNGMRGGRWSNAANWDDNAKNLGILVDDNPIPGAIAQWNEGEIGGCCGHVAYVEAVDKEAGKITISEYNYDPCSYGERTLELKDIPRYIHISEKDLD